MGYNLIALTPLSKSLLSLFILSAAQFVSLYFYRTVEKDAS